WAPAPTSRPARSSRGTWPPTRSRSSAASRSRRMAGPRVGVPRTKKRRPRRRRKARAMCGIVGYVGEKNAVSIIIEGLKRLEYRGYDSAGVAVLGDGGTLDVRRAAGRMKVLEGIL